MTFSLFQGAFKDTESPFLVLTMRFESTNTLSSRGQTFVSLFSPSTLPLTSSRESVFWCILLFHKVSFCNARNRCSPAESEASTFVSQNGYNVCIPARVGLFPNSTYESILFSFYGSRRSRSSTVMVMLQ